MRGGGEGRERVGTEDRMMDSQCALPGFICMFWPLSFTVSSVSSFIIDSIRQVLIFLPSLI